METGIIMILIVTAIVCSVVGAMIGRLICIRNRAKGTIYIDESGLYLESNVSIEVIAESNSVVFDIVVLKTDSRK